MLGETTVLIIHLIDGILMLAMMALMFFTIRLVLNCRLFAEWLRKRQASGKEEEPSGGRPRLRRKGRG